MLCWEAAHDCHAGSKWCHRHLAAQWLEDRLGIEVQEVGFPNLDRFAYLRKLTASRHPAIASGLAPLPKSNGSDNDNYRKETGTNLPALSEPRQSPLAAPPADELAFALQFARAEKSPSTRRAYRSDFDAFRKWCGVRKLNALPASPATFATFLASEAKRGVKASTIARRVAGVSYAHLTAGHVPPGQSEIVKATVRGIRRTIGAAPNRKEPLTAELVRAMVKSAPNNLTGLRDRAVLLLGFAGAMRRSELVGLNVNDLKDTKAGLRLYIRTSKTDQERLGQIVAIAPGKIVCPVKALRAWMAAAKITSGPIFRPI